MLHHIHPAQGSISPAIVDDSDDLDMIEIVPFTVVFAHALFLIMIILSLKNWTESLSQTLPTPRRSRTLPGGATTQGFLDTNEFRRHFRMHLYTFNMLLDEVDFPCRENWPRIGGQAPLPKRLQLLLYQWRLGTNALCGRFV